MFRSLVILVTIPALTVHAMMGCCRYGHAHVGVCGDHIGSAPAAAHPHPHRPECTSDGADSAMACHHADAPAWDDPESSSERPQHHHHQCSEDFCAFVVADSPRIEESEKLYPPTPAEALPTPVLAAKPGALRLRSIGAAPASAPEICALNQVWRL